MLINSGLQILQQKTFSIKKASRQKQLEKRMNTLRKNLTKARIEQQIQPRRQRQTCMIGQLIKKLKENQPNSIFQLWEHCLSFSYRYLTEEHILLLVEKLKQLNSSALNRVEDITMGVWLISSWTSTIQKITVDFQDLIQFLGKILDENLNAKLNKCILCSFANLCTDVEFAKKIINGDIVNKVINCPTFMEKESDVAFFINSCLQGLDTDYISEETLFKQIVNFVQRSLKKSSSDYYLRKDLFQIIKKFINKANKQQMLSQLSLQLKALMMTIQSMSELQSCQEMFAMLTIIAENNSLDISFFDQRLETTLWNCIKNLLCLQNTINPQFYEQEQLIKQIWKFMNPFFKRVSYKLQQQILKWLLEQCMLSQTFQSEDIALIFLTQNLKDDDLIIELCDSKLDQFKNRQVHTESMLRALKRVLLKQDGVIKIQSREYLCQCLKNLTYHQNEIILNLAIEIREKLSQCRMEEQIQSKNHILQIN